jgi:hypothetical protein
LDRSGLVENQARTCGSIAPFERVAQARKEDEG